MHTSFFQLGRLHIPVFGVVAALGLMAALGLSQRTARYVGLDPAAVWDVGMAGVIAAFVFSRALLVVFNLHSFLMYPMLVLAVPSLTGTGLLLTAMFTGVYLRWKGLPLLAVLDAMAPCGAVLAAALSLGRMLDGTRDGMPTKVPWATSGFGVGGVHPVEVYSLVVALVVSGILLAVVRREARLGEATAWGLLLGGLSLYFLDFVRVPASLFPADSTVAGWLDPAQFVALVMVAVGCGLLIRRAGQIVVRIEKDDPMGVEDAV